MNNINEDIFFDYDHSKVEDDFGFSNCEDLITSLAQTKETNQAATHAICFCDNLIQHNAENTGYVLNIFIGNLISYLEKYTNTKYNVVANIIDEQTGKFGVDCKIYKIALSIKKTIANKKCG